MTMMRTLCLRRQQQGKNVDGNNKASASDPPRVGNLAKEDARGCNNDDDRCCAAQSTKTKTMPRQRIVVAVVNKDIESVPQHQRPSQQWEGAQ